MAKKDVNEMFRDMDKITKLNMEKQQHRLNEMSTEMLKNQTEGIYNYIRKIEKKKIFIYASIIMAIAFVFSFINIKANIVIAIIIGLIIAYYLNERNNSIGTTDMKDLEIKMTQIFPPPKYFYIDSGIIELIHNIQEFKVYNEKSFTNMIKYIDNFLKIRLDIENNVRDCEHNVDVARNFMDESLNALHSIIHTTPNNSQFIDKLTNALNSLQYILQLHLDYMINSCNNRYKETGPNINNKILYDDRPLGIDDIKYKGNNYYVYY